MTSNTNSNDLGGGGVMYITITLISQNKTANTSYFHVYGELQNNNGGATGGNGPGCFCSLSIQQYFEDTFSSHFDAHERRTIISHYFTVSHGSDGDLRVHWNFHIGNTGTTTFGGNRDVDAYLTVPHIDQPASKPGRPSVTAIAADSIDLTWTAPTDDGGSQITDYILRRYDGSAATGTHIDSNGLQRNRHITGLIPGATYTFTVVAINGSQINSGVSVPSTARTITMEPGPNVRVAGEWKKSVCWVRQGGEWVQGKPYIRSGGIWRPAI
jgi:Fibronectin type III domain